MDDREVGVAGVSGIRKEAFKTPGKSYDHDKSIITLSFHE
jgi:hypothetical protein